MSFPKSNIDEVMETRPLGGNTDSKEDESSSILSTESYDATTTFHESYTGGSMRDRNKRVNNNNINNDANDEIKSSEQSTKEIRQVRLIVVLVLLISIAGAVAVFLYTKNSEEEQFEFQFQDDSNKVRKHLLVLLESIVILLWGRTILCLYFHLR